METKVNSIVKDEWPGEWLAVDGSEPFQQGDIVKFLEPETPWKTWGVVVTADCDIDKNKHRGIMSYVPLMELQDYWRLFTLPKQLNKAEVGFLEQLANSVRSCYGKTGDAEPIGMDSIHAMIMGASDASILKLLNISPGDTDKWTRILSVYRRLALPRDEIGIQNLIKLTADTKTAISGEQPNDISVLKDIEKSVDGFPGDAFFISRIPNEENVGFVAYLRLVRELNSSAIAVIAKDLTRKDVVARRVGRMKSPFLYRLTQQLAQVFSDIGLPAEYEADRRIAANKVKEKLVKNIKEE